eukprot:scaffold359778_cov35-Attheya_sp.AAC.1
MHVALQEAKDRHIPVFHLNLESSTSSTAAVETIVGIVPTKPSLSSSSSSKPAKPFSPNNNININININHHKIMMRPRKPTNHDQIIMIRDECIHVTIMYGHD